MVEQSKNSIRISGSGTATGGMYDTVRIDGTGQITGDIECLTFTSNGSSSVDGSIIASEMTTNGSARVSGHAQVERFVANGSVMVEGHVSAQRVTNSGAVRVHGNLNAEEVNCTGEIKIGGSCQAKSVKVTGSFHIQEQLHADQIDITLHGNSDAKEIDGAMIRVVKSKFSLMSLLWLTRTVPRLTAGRIEGDVVELENTEASIVQGKRVRIGKHCEIGLLEYEEAYEVSPEANVRQVRRIGEG